jgi:hypothetical protein
MWEGREDVRDASRRLIHALNSGSARVPFS